MPRAVTMIPATKNKFTALPTASIAKRRTAAYARVSTDSDEQFTSYEAQIDYYTKFIKARDDWEFVKIYTDEGISALNTKHRSGFNEMVQDALDGKIDLIVTKSVSRFARNTVDSLTTVRKLKEHGTEIYFEKENIFTFDSKGELLITIMSSLAQEESRSISENVTWGKRKRFSDGKVNMPYKRFLGYEKGEDGLPQIVEKEAAVIRLIYKLYLDGKTPSGICKCLESAFIPTPGGKEKWSQSTVSSILKNEKYKGDALLQKMFLKAYNQMMGNRDSIIEDCELMRTTLCNCTNLDADITKWQEEIEVVAELVRKFVSENVSSEKSQDEYSARYDSLVKRYEKAVAKRDALTAKQMQKAEQSKGLYIFIEALRESPLVLSTWDERLWIALVEKATIHFDGSITFTFKNGAEFEVKFEI